MRIVMEARPDPRFPMSRSELLPLLQAILSELSLDGADLTLRVVGDAEIGRLNQAFLGCFGPTNILSFPAMADEDDGEAILPVAAEEDDSYLGEMALSVDTLVREVRLYGQEPKEHLIRLLTHSVLHLAGFDHGPEMDFLTESTLDSLA